jgi:hypothetical protein
MTTTGANKGKGPRLPLIVGVMLVVTLVIVLVAMSNYEPGLLGAGGAYDLGPSGAPRVRIVDQKFQCSAGCTCYTVRPSETPNRDEVEFGPEVTAEWTSCVTVRNQLVRDAETACEAECEIKGDNRATVHLSSISCEPIGDC